MVQAYYSSQYDQLKGGFEVDTTVMKEEFSRFAEDRVLTGVFAKEFMEFDKGCLGVEKEPKELYA